MIFTLVHHSISTKNTKILHRIELISIIVFFLTLGRVELKFLKKNIIAQQVFRIFVIKPILKTSI